MQCILEHPNAFDLSVPTQNINSDTKNEMTYKKYFVHEILNPMSIIGSCASIIINDIKDIGIGLGGGDISKPNKLCRVSELSNLIKEQVRWCKQLSEEFLNVNNLLITHDEPQQLSPESIISIDSSNESIFNFLSDSDSSRNSSPDSTSSTNIEYDKISSPQSPQQSFIPDIININEYLIQYIKKFMKINKTVYEIEGIISNINHIELINVEVIKSNTYLKIILDNIIINAILRTRDKYIYLRCKRVCDDYLQIKITNRKYVLSEFEIMSQPRKSHNLGLELVNNLCQKMDVEWNIIETPDNLIEFNLYLKVNHSAGK
jgi:hypothetical protein